MSADLEIRHCRTLIAVADCGGISAAARTLGLAQSTVSESLHALERAVGATVTVRRPGLEVTLTPAGKVLLPFARRLVSSSEAARAAVSGAQRTVVRLGASESISSFLLPRVLVALRAERPLVEVQVTVGLCADLRDLLERGELDAALTLQAPGDPATSQAGAAYDAWRLADVTLSLIASPADLAARAVMARSELLRRGLLLPDPEGILNRELRAWFGADGRAVKFESAGSLDGLKRSVLAGGSLGVIPTYAALDDFASGRLAELSTTEALPQLVLEMAVQDQAQLFPALADLVARVSAFLSDAKPALDDVLAGDQRPSFPPAASTIQSRNARILRSRRRSLRQTNQKA
ncbi:MAG: LysR family transcriptional regulator [Caulobacterales bacterium]|jgi:DNA-binding transcriptional LysR family regulator